MYRSKFFLSWAHGEGRAKKSFLKLLKPRLESCKNHEITWWEDSFILPGEEWLPQILEHLEDSDYIVQLVSPAFLASNFIRTYEIPGVGNTPMKNVLPVMLVDLPLWGAVEFFGINDNQIYRGTSSKRNSYISCKTELQRIEFVDGFVEQIINRIEDKGGYR